jgi:hypothetical protein
MRAILKKLARSTGIYHPLLYWSRKWRHDRDYGRWLASGRPPPRPHGAKQQTLLDYAERYNLRILVETGTFYGDMVHAMKSRFDRIYSIELSPELWREAASGFARYRHIEIIHGDSTIELEKLVKEIERPAMFWLDGHYSMGVTALGEKETPIMEELVHVFSSPVAGHVILIDDARCFGRNKDFPSLEELQDFVTRQSPHSHFEVGDDIIRITPGVPTPAR